MSAQYSRSRYVKFCSCHYLWISYYQLNQCGTYMNSKQWRYHKDNSPHTNRIQSNYNRHNHSLINHYMIYRDDKMSDPNTYSRITCFH